MPGRRSYFREITECPYHVTFDPDLDLEHILDAGPSGDHGVWCAIFLVEEAICAKRLQTDGRQTPRDCIGSFHEPIA